MLNLLFLGSLLSFATYFQNNGVKFENNLSWEQILAKAKAEDKYIFVDCFASWCGPCKQMDNDVYPAEKVGEFMNSRFISVKVQMDTSQQDGIEVRQWYSPAHELMKRYNISAFPNFLFFSPNGKLVHRGIGFRNTDDLISLAQNAINPGKQYYTLLDQYKNRNLDSGNFSYLARMAKDFGETELAHRVANDYINRLNVSDLFKIDIIWLMVDFTKSSKDRGFSFFRDYGEKIYQLEKRIDEKQSKGIVENIIYVESMKPFSAGKNGGPDWDKMKKKLKQYGVLGTETYLLYKPNIIFNAVIVPAMKINPDWEYVLSLIKKQHSGMRQEFLVMSVLNYYNNNLLGNFNNFLACSIFYDAAYSSYLTEDQLNTLAWTVFEHSSDTIALTKALAWSDRAIRMNAQPGGMYLDTYANLLYKLGHIKDAIKWENRADSLSPDDKDIHGNFQKMIRGIPTWESK